MADPIRINGSVYSWASVRIKLGSETYVSISSITYDDKRPRSNVHGQSRSRVPIAQAPGAYEASEVKIKMLREEADLFRAALARSSADGKGFGDTEFLIDVMYEEGSKVVQDTIEQCHYVGTSSAAEANEDPMTQEITVQPRYIRWNGLSLFDGGVS